MHQVSPSAPIGSLELFPTHLTAGEEILLATLKRDTLKVRSITFLVFWGGFLKSLPFLK